MKQMHRILILIALLAAMCLVFAACGSEKNTEDTAEESAATTEQAEVVEAAEKVAEDTDAVTDEPADTDVEDSSTETEKNVKEEKSSKEKSKKEKKTEAKSSGNSGGSAPAPQPQEKQKVWVEPVTETRTVTLDTGTRYCNGANSNGGCGASWHGTKDSTYSSWKNHWQDYVKRRTEEEAAKGNTYVCDHIHDDSRWVPDTTTETVVIQEGYWKEVD